MLAAFAALGFVLGSFYVRQRLKEWRSAAAASSPQSAAPPASLPRPHLSIVVGTPPVKKPTIDVNALPSAPPNTTQRVRPPLNLKRPPVKPTPRPAGPSSESAPAEVQPPTPDRATRLDPLEI
jgi:hypothetical protein